MTTLRRRRLTTTVVSAAVLAALVVPLAAVKAADAPEDQPGSATTIVTSATPAGLAGLVRAADGTSYVGFASSNGTVNVARVARRVPGADWEAPVDLSDGALPANPPQLAVRPDGGVAALWTEWSGGTPWIWYAELPGNGTWSDPVRLVTGGRDARLAVGADGTVVAVWQTTADYRVQAVTRPPGGEWSAVTPISGPAGSAATQPEVAVDATGDAIAVWLKIAGTGAGISKVQSARLAGGGAWSAPVDASVPQAESASDPTVVVDATGVATVAWVQYFPLGTDDYTARAQVATLAPDADAWTATEDLSTSGTDARSVSLDLDADGVVTAAWPELKGTTTTIRAARRVAGQWGTSAVLGTSAALITGRDRGVALDVAPNGRAAAGWVESTPEGSYFLEVASARGNGSWSAPLPASAPVGSAGNPYVAVTDDGDADAAWNDLDTGFSVKAAFLDRTAPVVDRLDAPTAGVAGTPLTFSVASHDRWSDATKVRWTFGDGRTASGATATHTFRSGGRYRVTATVADASGNTATRSATVEVTGPPRVTSLRLSEPQVKVPGTRADAPLRTRLTIGLSDPSRVTITVRGTRGSLPTATLRKTLPAGRSVLTLAAKVGSTVLRPGRYAVTVVARNADGTSAPRRVDLRVVSGR